MATRSIRFIDSFRNLKISLLAGKWPQKPRFPSGKWAYPFDILDLFSIFDLILFGQTKSLTTNSKVKKMMMMLSIVSMMNTTVGNCALPSESWNYAFKRRLVVLVVSAFCSSSAVEMMKVRVETKT